MGGEVRKRKGVASGDCSRLARIRFFVYFVKSFRLRPAPSVVS